MELVQLINENTPAKAGLFRWHSEYKVQPNADVGRPLTQAGHVVADVIPNPPRTHFIKDAEARGCTIIDGLGILVNQGVIGIKYWIGVDAGASVMRRKLE